MADVVINDAALYDLLHSPDGPVGIMVEDLAAKMTATAEALAPTQKPWNHSWSFRKSTSYMPWSTSYLKANVRMHIGYTQSGEIFGGTNAPYGPTLFLEKPARQMHTAYPFMTTALDEVEL